MIILHRKQPTHKATAIMDDCQPGKYIPFVYDKEWFLGIILMTSEEDQDVEQKFMISPPKTISIDLKEIVYVEYLSTMFYVQLKLSVPNLLVHLDAVYLIMNLIISWKCLKFVQFEYFISFIVFHYNNLTAISKFQVTN